MVQVSVTFTYFIHNLHNYHDVCTHPIKETTSFVISMIATHAINVQKSYLSNVTSSIVYLNILVIFNRRLQTWT